MTARSGRLRLSVALAAALLAAETPAGAQGLAEAAAAGAASELAGQAVKSAGMRRVLLWPVNRVLDVIDVGRADASVGPGFGVNVHPTRIAQVGLGSFAGLRVGWLGRQLPVEFVNKAEGGLSVLYLETGERRPFSWVGLNLHLLLVGAEAGVDPWQVVDLLTGIFFWDVADDDL